MELDPAEICRRRTSGESSLSPKAALVTAAWFGLAGGYLYLIGLIARTELMDTWRRLPSLDPELPSSLLPAGWPRGRCREIFMQVYDGLGPLAELRVRQIVATYSPEIAERAEHHTTASAPAGPSAGDGRAR